MSAALSMLAAQASAHYIFEKITVGGTQYGKYEHIRENTNYNSPVTGTDENKRMFRVQN